MTATAGPVRGTEGLVASSDALATEAGVAMLRLGGSAADAAVAAGAVLAVTAPYACGLGGDLLAMVHGPGREQPQALMAAGASGSGADSAALRAQGHTEMPYQNDVRSTTVPGCVDGWLALLEQHGRLPLARVLGPAEGLAREGFAISAVLAGTLAELDGSPAPVDLAQLTREPGTVLQRPGVARTLRAVADGGRDAFYAGEFGVGLLELGGGYFSAADLVPVQARWVQPLHVRAWGHDIWTTPPPTQGYITLLTAAVADALELPADPTDPEWVHLVVEACVAAGFDRPAFLHEFADAAALLSPETVRARAASISRERRSDIGLRAMIGDTTYLCATDRDGLAVSLIQSNAAGYGSHLFEPATGIHLQNRGIGFSLEPGHPAEFGPNRRPPHTLCPALVTDPAGRPRVLIGAAGGDAQPQAIAQMLARILHSGEDAWQAVSAPRFRLGALAGTGFDTWTRPDGTGVLLEDGVAQPWVDGLRQRGHRVDVLTVAQAYAGQGQVIELSPEGAAGACEPRVAHAAVAGP